MSDKLIRVANLTLNSSALNFANEALQNNELSGNSGHFNELLEQEFVGISGAKYAITVCNGTCAIHLALAALNIGKGDEVIVSTLTNMATLFAIIYTGATPVPIDIDKVTWNIAPDLIESKITTRTKAILVVHLFGHPVDMDPISIIAKKNNLFLVEDAAEAHGAKYKGRKVGSLGDVSCFSFYANKIVGAGEGGLVATSSESIAARVRELKSLAYGSINDRFQHTDIGYNYRLPNIMAAIAYGQSLDIDMVVSSKRKIANYYKNEILELDCIQKPVEMEWAHSVYWMYHVVLRGKLKEKRDLVQEKLYEMGIETRVSFVPADMQKSLIKTGLVEPNTCPVAGYVGENGFYLPSGPFLTDIELSYISSSVNHVVMNL
jgi:perosamine synthetase